MILIDVSNRFIERIQSDSTSRNDTESEWTPSEIDVKWNIALDTNEIEPTTQKQVRRGEKQVANVVSDDEEEAFTSFCVFNT